MNVQLADIRNTSELASNETYFDLYDGDKLVAHVSRPRVYDKDGRWMLTTYNHDRSIIKTERNFFPIGAAKHHMRRLRNTDLSK
jgi:hypothetical protein